MPIGSVDTALKSPYSASATQDVVIRISRSYSWLKSCNSTGKKW